MLLHLNSFQTWSWWTGQNHSLFGKKIVLNRGKFCSCAYVNRRKTWTHGNQPIEHSKWGSVWIVSSLNETMLWWASLNTNYFSLYTYTWRQKDENIRIGNSSFNFFFPGYPWEKNDLWKKSGKFRAKLGIYENLRQFKVLVPRKHAWAKTNTSHDNSQQVLGKTSDDYTSRESKIHPLVGFRKIEFPVKVLELGSTLVTLS